jgi:ribosome biogenesis GTPase
MAKHKKKIPATAPAQESWREGTLVKSTGSFYEVELPDGQRVTCTLRGKFRMSEIRSTNPVAVGDHVRISIEEPTSVIQEMLPRKNYVLRRSINLSRRVHVLCANIDLAIILFTLDQPVTTLGYVDRLLVTCEAYHIPVLIVFNKLDVLQSDEMTSRLADYRAIYEAAGYETLALSAHDPQYQQAIQTRMQGMVSFVVGRSGAGKSTLINLADPTLKLKTGSISEFSGRGKHTTTHAEMFPLSFGGHIIDSPGFKEMEIFDIEQAELSGYFPEMRPLLDDCKFHNCIHQREPGCAVKQAVAEGKIAESRYHTYLGMLEEIKKQG